MTSATWVVADTPTAGETETMLKLVIGNKNYSSWSLRPWLLLVHHGVPFEEIRIPLYVPGAGEAIAKHSKAGKVPVLHDGELLVWDSLAILEYVSDRYLQGRGWPGDVETRAVARSCSAEMHSGFTALRSDMPMNCRATGRTVTISPELKANIARIDQLWQECRTRHDKEGPWLFGEFSIADCMFTPVVTRFNTYGVEPSPLSAQYMRQVLEHDGMQRWMEASRNEPEVIESAEKGTREGRPA